MKRAFTLIEVTLALGILAGGILTVVGLYGLGYRESNQSREDVAAAAVADYVLSQLVSATVATTNWTPFATSLGNYPENKWEAYLNTGTGLISGNPTAKASGAFNDYMRALGATGTYKFPDEGFASMNLKYGLVILHDRNSPVVRFAFRATRQPQLLMSAPLFYTEARYQGVAK